MTPKSRDKVKVFMCPNCGEDDWEMLYHDDTGTGGGWMYRCQCRQVSVYMEYSDTGIDDLGKTKPITYPETKKR